MVYGIDKPKSIELLDPEIPDWIANDLEENFDAYDEWVSPGMCPNNKVQDGWFSVEEFVGLMGHGSFDNALATFKDRYPGYVPNFETGTIQTEPLSPEQIAENQKKQTLRTAVHNLKSTLEDVTLQDFDAETQKAYEVIFSKEDLLKATQLLAEPNQTIAPDTLNEMSEFLSQHPEIDVPTLLSLMQDFLDKDPSDHQRKVNYLAIVFGENQDLINQVNSEHGQYVYSAYAFCIFYFATLWQKTDFKQFVYETYED